MPITRLNLVYLYDMLLVLLLDFLRNRYWISIFKTWSFFRIFFIIFSYKKIAVKKLRAGKLTDKIFSRQEKLSLSYILKSFLNFSKFEPPYPYKLYSWKNVCLFLENLSKTASMFWKAVRLFSCSFFGRAPPKLKIVFRTQNRQLWSAILRFSQ